MLQAAIQGLIQGLTEFLPVSSSGHLVLSQQLFNFKELDPAFNVFVQGGTVFSVLLFYWSRLITLTKKYFLQLVLTILPVGVVGVLLGDYIDSLFSSTLYIAFGFLITSIIVWVSRYGTRKGEGITPKQALIVGLAQIIALVPGISRSGTTITAGLLAGIDSDEAFDLSFLSSIPTVAGAAILSTRHISWDQSMTNSYIVGFIIAAVVGYFCLHLLARMMRRGHFYFFAPYTLILSLVSFLITR